MSSENPFDGENPQPEPRTHARRNSSAVPLNTPPPAPRRVPRMPRASQQSPEPSPKAPQHPRSAQPLPDARRTPPPSFPVHPPEKPSGGQVPPTRVMPAQPQRTRPAPTAPRAVQPPRKRRRGLRIALVLLVVLLAWPIGLVIWGNGKIHHVEALSAAPDTPGRTYLLAGSDSRAEDFFDSHGTNSQRADTIMLLTIPESGNSSLISLPRDTYVEIPGHQPNKINAAYSLGGPALLVETVEQLTGQKIDHYVEIGMDGVANIVDAVGGVELCLDYDVNDSFSKLEWEAGCHVVDGEVALAFARMRKQDPLGDIGRNQRQQQVIRALTSEAVSPSLLNPLNQVKLARAGFSAFATDDDTGVVELARLVWAFRALSGDSGVRGAPPLADLNYRPGGVGSAVRLADNYPEFFRAVADGTVTPEMLNQ